VLLALVPASQAAPALDPTFNGGTVQPKLFPKGKRWQVARGAVLQADGKVVVPMSIAPYYGQRTHRPVLRFNPDGSRDLTYGENGTAWVSVPHVKYMGFGGIAIQPDGKTLVNGSIYRKANSEPRDFVARLTTTGKVDRGFADHGILLLPRISQDERFVSATQLSDGDLMITTFSGYSGDQTAAYFRRLDPNGHVKRAFGKRGVATFVLSKAWTDFPWPAAVKFSGESAFVFTAFGDEDAYCKLTKLSIATGAKRDTSFGGQDASVIIHGADSADTTGCGSMTIVPDGHVLATGSRYSSAADIENGVSETEAFVTEFTADGSLEPAFGKAGTAVLPNLSFSQIAVTASGSILLTGNKMKPSGRGASTGTAATLDAAGTVFRGAGWGGEFGLAPRSTAGPIYSGPSGAVVVYLEEGADAPVRSYIARFTN
jgi:uncharacterized delta-60 repeat protein